MMVHSFVAVALLAGLGAAKSLSVESHDDIVASAKTIAFDLMTLYKGNETGGTPGILPGPPPAGDYYWWEGASFLSTYIDYWHVTGDETYNDVVTQGLLHQRGPNDAYMPPNITAQLSNDDQCSWGLASMIAAENQFPDPPKGEASWAAVAANVFDTIALRFDMEAKNGTCGGGLRWQVPMSNVGYDYKNSMSSGCFFNLGARLARYTGNETYAKQAAEAWDWLTAVGFIDKETWAVYDGAHVDVNCTDINKTQFSYVAAILTEGVAYMYNYTSASTLWKSRLDSLTNSTLKTFFPENIAVEIACESRNSCTTEMFSFKGLLHRYLAGTTQLAPYTAEKILPVLKTSAKAAARQCTGGDSGTECGFYWADGKYIKPESSTGAGERMSVLAAVDGLLVGEAAAPVTEKTGGTGTSDTGGSGSGSGSGSGTGSAPSSTPSSGTGRTEIGLVAGLVGLITFVMA